jgi:hypothetical protein
MPFSADLSGTKAREHRARQEQRSAVDRRGCEKLGITATEDERLAMLQQVKAKSFEKKDLLTADEFRVIVDRVMQKAPV